VAGVRNHIISDECARVGPSSAMLAEATPLPLRDGVQGHERESVSTGSRFRPARSRSGHQFDVVAPDDRSAVDGELFARLGSRERTADGGRREEQVPKQVE
jgi:hypothetical protein